MADFTQLGTLVAQFMERVEDHPSIPDNAEIGTLGFAAEVRWLDDEGKAHFYTFAWCNEARDWVGEKFFQRAGEVLTEGEDE